MSTSSRRGRTSGWTWSRRAAAGVLALGLLTAAACGDDDDEPAVEEPGNGETTTTAAASGPQELVGLFGIDAGVCSDAGVTEGSYFRMVQSGGSLDAGPFVENGDSSCGDKTWNALVPGSDGGLRTGDFQPFDEPPFDATGNATTTSIIEPVPFFAVGFAVGTNETDPQTGDTLTAPQVTDDGGTLTGDLSAFAAAWNNQHFNQGSPKPDGSMPGITSEVTGTYDPSTGRYTLEWASQIVGGPFNDFTGVWHLEGTFEAG